MLRRENEDLRKYREAAGVRQWELAEHLGMTEFTFCRKLRHELSKEEKKQIKAAIDEIKNR